MPTDHSPTSPHSPTAPHPDRPAATADGGGPSALRRVRVLAVALMSTALAAVAVLGWPDRSLPPAASGEGLPSISPPSPATSLMKLPSPVTSPATVREPASLAPAPEPLMSPGPALWGPGATGEEVRRIQARLIQIAWLPGPVTGNYDPATVTAIRGFQKKRQIPVTGEVDQRTWDRLVGMTGEPTHAQLYNLPEVSASGPEAPLDARCRTGRVLCVDKSSRSLRWVIDGRVQARFDARFGSDELPTREGAFTVYSKSRDHVSSLYNTSMPLAMFFSGGQAVHYSPDFAAHGYAGNSHGCVNIRDYNGISWLFDQVRVGDRVVVYRS